jgi:2-amino-4-hydroxy-6-hydroxymethyldihydropteridine diphosphokinase
MNTCIIEIGSNIDPEANVEKALSILKSEMHVVSNSNFLKTAPVGITNQSHFLNGAVKIKTELNKEQLNKYLKDIEYRLKRNHRQQKYGPRTIDLDIIVWNGTVVDDDYYTRDFVKSTVDELL